MRRLRALAFQEWRLQARSGRFRFSALGYLVLSSVPSAIVFFLVRDKSPQMLGPNTYLGQTLAIQPFLTTLLAILLTGARSGSDSQGEQWSPLSSAPISNVGFLLRRWLVLFFSLLLPLVFFPLIVAASFAYAANSPVTDWQTWLAGWVVVVLPRALVVSASWLALVTITGSELLALVFGLLSLATFQAILNQILVRFQLTLGDALEWFGIDEIYRWIRSTQYFFSSTRGRYYHSGFASTEAPFDLFAAWDWLMPRVLLPAALALGLLVVAGLFLGRTRRDLRPRPLRSNHPLRTYIKLWNDFRARRAPDAALSLGEHLVMLVGVMSALVLFGALLHRLQHFGHLATERYFAATSYDIPPTANFVRPTVWRITGELRTGGADLEGEGGLENRGSLPVGELALTLNHGLRVLEMEVEGHRVEQEKIWDRLLLRLDPPLPPGKEITLRWRLGGMPSKPVFGLRRRRGAVSFVLGYQRHHAGLFPRQLTDFSRGRMRNAMNDRRIDLQPGDLAPIPRYSSWKLTPPKASPNEYGQLVPPEILHFEAEVNLDLVIPEKWFLADACSHTSRAEGSQNRLGGTCRIALSQLVVRGGALEVLEESTGEISLAMLPQHRDRGRALLRTLTAAARLSDRAWPGSQGLKNLVVIEWPPDFDIDMTKHLRSTWGHTVRVERHGQLLSLPEGDVIGIEPLEGESLVVSSLVPEQLRRREFHVHQNHIFKALFHGLMIRRMGLDEDGATFSGAPWTQNLARQAIMESEPFSREVLDIRVPSVMVEVESRVGSRQLHQGIEMFLNRKDAPPGTVRELFADLEKVSGVSLERMYADYFEGRAMPTLRLEEVEATREVNGRWRVQGKVHNTGSGEVMCPVVVKATVGETKQVLTVDTESATSFDVLMNSRPLTVLLDPNKTCYRYVHKNSDALERVYLQGGGV